jgi:hypothetical protein
MEIDFFAVSHRCWKLKDVDVLLRCVNKLKSETFRVLRYDAPITK